MMGFDIRLAGRRRLVDIDDYRAEAFRRVPPLVEAFVDGGSFGQASLRRNLSQFADYHLRSRPLEGGQPVDLTTRLFEDTLSLPVLLAPTGFLGLSRWCGDLEAARAAETTDTRFVVSTAASWSLEEIAKESKRLYFQLYPWDGAFVTDLILRAESQGITTLVVTVDTPAVGKRNGERRAGMGIPPQVDLMTVLGMMRYPRWLAQSALHQRFGGRNLVKAGGAAGSTRAAVLQQRTIDQSRMTWEDVKWLRDQWQGRFILKGVFDAEDAAQARSVGADGVWISNHGGRQLDGGTSGLEVLAQCRARTGPDYTLIYDGGIRTGLDAIKAMALGADLVAIGRPYIYGAIARGQSGIEGVIAILREEMQIALRLMGLERPAQLSPEHVWKGGT